MVPISIAYNGSLRCTSTHDDSGVSILTDAPKDNLGEGSSFSPTDLVAAALGTCMITTIGIKLRDQPVHFEHTTLALEKHMTGDQPRRIAKIVVRLQFPAGIPASLRTVIQHIGDTCPVRLSLHPDLVVHAEYHYPD